MIVAINRNKIVFLFTRNPTNYISIDKGLNEFFIGIDIQFLLMLSLNIGLTRRA